MKWIIAFMLVFLMCPAVAMEVRAPVADGSIVFTDTKCESETILASLKPEAQPFYFAGRFELSDRTVVLCWRLAPSRQAIWIIDEEGDTAVIPVIKGVEGVSI